jgi:hypothetical protein
MFTRAGEAMRHRDSQVRAVGFGNKSEAVNSTPNSVGILTFSFSITFCFFVVSYGRLLKPGNPDQAVSAHA